MIAILELGNAFEDWNGGETGRVESKRVVMNDKEREGRKEG